MRRGSTWRRLWGETTGYRRHIFGLFVLELASTPMALLYPVPLKIAVDSAIGDRPVPAVISWALPDSVTSTSMGVLLTAAGLMVALGLVDHLRGLGSWVLGTYAGEQISFGVRAKLFAHVQRMSLAYHDIRGTSDSTYRIQYDAGEVKSIVTEGVTPFLTAGITLVAMLYITARLDWQLALAALVLVPVLLFVSRAYRKRLRSGWLEVKAFDTSAMSVVQETLAALRVVKAFGREESRQQQYLGHARRSVRGHVRMALLEGGLWMLAGITVVCGSAIVLFLGFRHVQAGTLSLGDLLVVMAYLTTINGLLETLTRQVGEVQSALASSERAFELLDHAPDVEERPNARPISRARGAITFDDVSFSYELSRQGVQNVSFSVEPGTCVGIAGATGAGKTTLTSLLCRFYDPQAGAVLLDGVDLREFRLADLRGQLAVVLQDPVLFTGGVAENIAYADPEASEHRIVEAAKAADAHDFITQLPDGYDTVVGERGMTLSGGQRQRLSLARAFLKDAPILVLDEPTSAVDQQTEESILRTMTELMAGRTTFLISHRTSMLQACDVVLHISAGRVKDLQAAGPSQVVSGG
ncbi:MAG: ABC transporter ATP-binding protein/permease [Actinomycetota bacterium]|nr:ABC transporter ATP-binding protein/permease [Actinomycetota bacterium]